MCGCSEEAARRVIRAIHEGYFRGGNFVFVITLSSDGTEKVALSRKTFRTPVITAACENARVYAGHAGRPV